MTSKIIMGYFTSWSIYGSNFNVYDIPNVDKLTHLVYAFAGVSTSGSLTLLDSWADKDKPFVGYGDTNPLKTGYLGGNLHQVFRLKKQYRNLKTGISIGGYGTGSANIATAISTNTKRTTFANSIKTWVTNFGLDFIDIDWEYPSSSTEANNCLLFLQKIKSVNPTLKLFFSLSANYNSQLSSVLSSMKNYVDVFQLMALDYVGSTWGSTIAAHQSLYSGNGSGEINTNDLVNDLVNTYSISPNSIIIECPLYGVPSGTSSSYSTTFDYKGNDLINMENNYSILDNDRVTQKTYDADGVLITYDSIYSIDIKANYVITNNLRGLSFWELSKDRTGTQSLLLTSYNVLNTYLDLSNNNLNGYTTSIYKNIKDPSLA